jgi:hypothetical protein
VIRFGGRRPAAACSWGGVAVMHDCRAKRGNATKRIGLVR